MVMPTLNWVQSLHASLINLVSLPHPFKMGITLASPYSVSADNNASFLSILKDYHPTTPSEPLKTILVPVPADADIASIVSQTEKAMPLLKDGLGKDDIEVDVVDTEDLDDANAEVDPANFVELPLLRPRNRQHQLATVLLQRFPALKKHYIEKLISLLVLKCPEGIPRSFRFSIMHEGHAGDDTRNVFVQFTSVLLSEWLHKNKDAVCSLLPGIDMVFDSSVDGSSLMDMEESVKEELAKLVSRIVKNSRFFSKGSRITGTEDLDEVMSYYKTYKVENSELVEVPKDMKETIVKDIIRFRSKVLTIETEQRKKEIEKERLKAKARLTLIFKGIKAVAESEDVNMEEDEPAEKEETDPLGSLNDDEYEEHLRKQEEEKLTEEYNKQLLEMHKKEQEQAALVEKLSLTKNYEENLIENKFTIMEEMKSFHDLDLSSANTHRLKLYYTDHLEYLRLRNLERLKEEEMDDQDEKEESAQSTIKPKIAATIPQVESMDVVEPDVEVSKLPPAKLEQIQKKVSDMVEEYLGIKEEVLISFIYEFVLEKGLSQKAELIAELQETLDEDSTTVADELHTFIRGLA